MGDLHIRVREQLDAAAVPYTLRDHGSFQATIASPADFAAALGYPLGRITKTLVCQSRSTGVLAAVVCPMDMRIDFKRIAQELDCGRLEAASPQLLESATGYPRGGVSPLGLDTQIDIVIARQVLDYETVLIGGGALGIELEIAPHELIRITGARTIEFGASS